LRQIFAFLIILSFLKSDAIDVLNSYRRALGMIPLKKSSILKRAATKHAKYLYLNRRYYHYEYRGERAFFGSTPSLRIERAGFKTRAVVETITFNSYNDYRSIRYLLGTLYHRFGIFDFKVDIGGAGRYKNVLVIDMSNSYLNMLCQSPSRGEILNICYRGASLDGRSFYWALNRVRAKNPKYLFYPYKNQKRVPIKFYLEQPSPISYPSRRGFPITAQFNPYYFRSVRLVSFRLFEGKKRVSGKILGRFNDRYGKLKYGEYAFIPYSYLKRKKRYKVVIRVLLNGRLREFRWNFYTY